MKKGTLAPYEARERPHGKAGHLTRTETVQLAISIAELMTKGYFSKAELARKLKTDYMTIDRHMPEANLMLASFAPEKGTLRSLEQQRCYKMIERLTKLFKTCVNVNQKVGVANSIYKWSTHLAAISGLTVEVQGAIDPTQLVIIRSDSNKKLKVIKEADVINTEAIT